MCIRDRVKGASAVAVGSVCDAGWMTASLVGRAAEAANVGLSLIHISEPTRPY